MATCIASGSGKLSCRVTDYKGQSCRRTSRFAGVSTKSHLQKDLTWYVLKTLVQE